MQSKCKIHWFAAYAESGTQSPMILPASFSDAEVGAMERIAETFGLKLEKIKKNKQWAIVRPS